MNGTHMMARVLIFPNRLSPRSVFTRTRKLVCVLYENPTFLPSRRVIISERSKSVYIKHNHPFSLREFRTSVILCKEIVINAPDFPESVNEGDIKWQKKVGDSIALDEVVAEIETDKTALPVISPGNGVIVEQYVEDMSVVKKKQKLFKMKLTPISDQIKAAPISSPVQAPAPLKSAPVQPRPTPKVVPAKAIPTSPSVLPPSHREMTPAVIKVPPKDPAREISGTRTEFRVKMNRMRMRIAERLKNAQTTCAMLTTFNEIDMTGIIAFRKINQEAFTKKNGVKLGFMSPFLKAASFALQDQPVVNAVIEGNEIIYRDYIDISVAVATPKGLVVPVIRNVNSLNYGDIEKEIAAYAEKAIAGKLAIEDMDGGTFTVSNGGVFGSLMGTPIINPPQSAILGMHATFDRPAVIKGEIVIRPMMYVALTYDHRLIDGREAVLFLRKIKAAVEDPSIIVAGL